MGGARAHGLAARSSEDALNSILPTFAGAAAACIVVVAASGIAGQNLMLAILMHPEDYLLWPAAAGAICGFTYSQRGR